MALVAWVIAALCGAAVSATLFVRVPEPDRGRAYPKQPALCQGMTGQAASLRHAVGTRLLYALAWLVLAACEVVASIALPGRPGLALSVSVGAAGLGIALMARGLLRSGPGAMRVAPRASK